MKSEKITPLCDLLMPREFSVVFEKEAAASSCAVENHFRLEIRKKTFFIADHGIYTQGRIIAELMYRNLYDPTITNSKIGNIGGYFFSNVQVTNDGYFAYYNGGSGGSRPIIAAMPSVGEMVESLQKLGEIEGMKFFPRYNRLNRPAWDLLERVLRGKAADADSILVELSPGYTTSIN